LKQKSNTLKTNIYLLVLLLSSCVQDNYIARPNDYPSSWIPNILDKFQEGRSRYVASSITFPENLILFSGTRSDSLHFSLNSILLCGRPPSKPPFKQDALNTGLQITLCPTQNLAMFEDFDSIPPAPQLHENSMEIDSLATIRDYNKWISRKRNLIHAIPVIICNTGIEKILLEQQDEKLTMIQEAKDELGNWRPIEYWIFPRCGNSRSSIELLPNDLILTRIIRYKGDFETDIRLKLRSNLHVYYSNSYRGTIHKSQFNLPERLQRNYSEDGKIDKHTSDMFFLNY